VAYSREEEFMALRQASGARATALAGQQVDVTDDDAVHRLVKTMISPVWTSATFLVPFHFEFSVLEL
jgi:hypothetical protein